MTHLDDLARQWRTALADWALPQEILDAAPVSPWGHAPAMFRLDDEAAPDTASFREARRALGEGGTVLDVGCGGGRSSLPLGALITAVTGVDAHEAMLAQFREAAAARGVSCTTVLGQWPDVAASVPVADLVVCHHVAYNVGDIVPFVRALDDHARRRVVVELTARHPQSALSPLWQRFWGLARPTEPSYELFVAIVRAMGHEPSVSVETRPPRRHGHDRAEIVASVRQRLCLTADRDPEIDAALGADPAVSVDGFATVAWTPGGVS